MDSQLSGTVFQACFTRRSSQGDARAVARPTKAERMERKKSR